MEALVASPPLDGAGPQVAHDLAVDAATGMDRPNMAEVYTFALDRSASLGSGLQRYRESCPVQCLLSCLPVERYQQWEHSTARRHSQA